MSIEIDAGAGRPPAPFNAVDVEAEARAAESDPAEGWMMLFATLTGVLAASSLGVWVFLR